MKLEHAYLDNWPLSYDLKIILSTFPAVLFGKGAY
jgi:lipopolysaccharide/colanic/teichoic acid biosynthesis glycosyltransferase